MSEKFKLKYERMGRFMKIGILGAGRIAATLAETMNKMPEVECYGVSSRNLEKAEVFAKDHGFQYAFGSYEDMLADQNVELIILQHRTLIIINILRCVWMPENMYSAKKVLR